MVDDSETLCCPAAATASSGIELVGARLQGYRIERLLGAGGMGVVYEATQLCLNRRVALKLLADRHAGNRTMQARFRREALLQAAVQHPNILEVYETGDCEAGVFIAMRLVRGPTLRARLLEASLDPAEAIALLYPIADALDTAHDHGLIHRDVKPENILIGARERAYLADFGLVRTLVGDSLTSPGGIVGTRAYLAPEILHGGEVTKASDIYSFAAVALESLGGAAATAGDEPRGRVAGAFAQGLAHEPSARPCAAGDLMRLAEGQLHRDRAAARATPTCRPVAASADPPHRRRSATSVRQATVCVCAAVIAVSAWALASTTRFAAGGGPGPLGARIARPTVDRVPAAVTYGPGEFPQTPASARELGVAVEASVNVSGGADGVRATCEIRDLTANRVSTADPLLRLPHASTFTVLCWIRMTLAEGHRYEAIVRIWGPGVYAPLASSVVAFAVGPAAGELQ